MDFSNVADLQPAILLKTGFFYAIFSRIYTIFRKPFLRSSPGCVQLFYLYRLFENIFQYELAPCVNQSIDISCGSVD